MGCAITDTANPVSWVGRYLNDPGGVAPVIGNAVVPYQPAYGAGRSFGNHLFRRKLQTVKIPIACTLQPSDARSQLSEWQEMLRRVMDGSERVSSNRLELSLLPDADIGSVVSLAQRETACCAFFSFTIEIEADRVLLVVEVPNEAVEILDLLSSTAA
jgi:hypothetical protein